MKWSFSMSKLSCSFTLGKASKPGGANVEHNNREFLADNIDVNRIVDNVVYVRQNIRQVYDELFAESLAEYNAKQTRSDRKIDDYFHHIDEGSREESHYECIIQFGDMHTAGVGTENGELAKIMLDEYVRGFKSRNPNLKIFQAIMHLDEASPHLHINFIPFYTQGRKNGLSKGVSMKSALAEQGFSNSSKKQNSLVAWEESEMKVMEAILNRHGLERDIKGATHRHKSVPEFKESQDWRKLPRRKKRMSNREILEHDLRKSQQENSLLRVENEKLLAVKNSQWRSLFYADSNKQIFVQSKLSELNIPFRESEQGLEVQLCFLEKVRQIEKQYKANPTSHRDTLRDLLDTIVMQVPDYESIFSALEEYGYEVKHGKYTAVKPQYGSQFIRLKSLGEMYNELALRNRIENRNAFENTIDTKMNAVEDKRSLEFRYHYTVRQYVLTFKQGKLPARKVRKKEPFTFVNDAELDRLAALNRRINQGATITSLRNELATLEHELVEVEANLAKSKGELKFHTDLYNAAVRRFENGEYNPAAKKILEEHGITTENYRRLLNAVDREKSDVAELEDTLSGKQAEIKGTSETLTAFERIMSLTYVDKLTMAEYDKRQAERVGNGIKSADISLTECNRVNEVVAKVEEAVAAKRAYTPKRK
jgi:hypothetical protein